MIGAVYRTTGATQTIVKRYGYAYDLTGNRTTARTDDVPLLSAHNNMNRLTTQSGGGVIGFTATTSEAAWVRMAGKPATGAGTSAFAGSAVLASGTSTVAVVATDASGNTATQSYEVNVPTSTGSTRKGPLTHTTASDKPGVVQHRRIVSIFLCSPTKLRGQ